jgi:thiamine biosynthesis lipoprotein
MPRRSDNRAMGTTLSIVGAADGFVAATEVVRATFRREETRFSRFLPDSELSRVNAAAGSWVRVSEPFAALVRFSLDAARGSDGAFDPTVLHAMYAMGYDRDLDDVLRQPRSHPRAGARCGGWRDVRLRDRAIRLPSGVGLDLGGVAKGWTVDLAVDAALATGIPWILVSAGGDMRLAGDAPVLTIDVDDPADARSPLLGLRLDRGALATSSVTRRAWGDGLHHVIDPRTGLPWGGEAVQATVWAPRCAEAEVAATTLLLSEPGGPIEVPALVVHRDGAVTSSIASAGGDAA